MKKDLGTHKKLRSRNFAGNRAKSVKEVFSVIMQQIFSYISFKLVKETELNSEKKNGNYVFLSSLRI